MHGIYACFNDFFIFLGYPNYSWILWIYLCIIYTHIIIIGWLADQKKVNIKLSLYFFFFWSFYFRSTYSDNLNIN